MKIAKCSSTLPQWFIFFTFLISLPSFGFAQDRGLSVIAKQMTDNPDFDIGHQYAVIIGINKYKEWPSLMGAVSEAKAIRKVLADRYYIDEFFELYDTDATAANIRRLFVDTLPRKLAINDSLLVFYSGHGQLDATKTGFWIASDGSKDTYSQNNWIPNVQLRNMIGGLNAQRILILADACFSGDFLDVARGALPAIDPIYFRKGLQLMARQVLTSGASEAVPDESEFGRQVVSILERNQDPILDPISMYERLRRGVTKSSPLLGTMQGHEEGALFALFLRSDGSEKAQQAAVPAVTRTAELLVKAEVGAEVIIDGVSRGVAPLLVKKLDAGRPLKVQVRTPTLSGVAEVTLLPGEFRELSLVLSPLSGNMYLTANANNVELWVDGIDKGPIGDGIFKGLAVGERKIELKGNGLYYYSSVNIVPDETTEVKAQVYPVGQINFDAPDGAQLTLSGMGVTGSRNGSGAFIDIPIGDYFLNASGDGFISSHTTVTVKQGEITTWRPYEGGSIEFAVQPHGALYVLDGQPGGEAMGTIPVHDMGAHTLVLTKNGYHDVTIPLTVSLGKSVRVEAELKRFAPATLRYPDYGINIGFNEKAVDATPIESRQQGTRAFNIASGVPLKITFTSPFAEQLDLPDLETTFTEGEDRTLDIPSGQIVLPWIPVGAMVKIGSKTPIMLRYTGNSYFCSSPLPPGVYQIFLSGPVPYLGHVEVIADSFTEPTDYRRSIGEVLSQKRLAYEEQLSVKHGWTTAGWVSLVTGALGAIGTGATYLLETQAKASYDSALDTDTATQRWNTVQVYGALLQTSAVISIIGLGLSPLFFRGGRDSTVLQRSIEELDTGIKNLGQHPSNMGNRGSQYGK